MKNHLKSMLCLLMVLVMVFCMAACGETEPDESSAAVSETESDVSQTTEEQYYVDGIWTTKLGVLDKYKNKEFKLLVVGDDHATYQSDDFTTTPGSGGIDYGEAFYTQVQARNDWIEEKYEVSLNVSKEAGIYSYVDTVREDATAGTKLYDAMILTISDSVTIAQEGLLCDLHTLANFDIDAPWWDKSANEAYSVGGKLYFTTGDITIMNKVNTWAILFNKEMITNYNLEDPYKHFKDGTWTLDKMIEMANTVNTATQTNGDAGPEFEDSSTIYGMVTAYGDIFEFYGGSGMTLCTKDEEDNPVLSFGMNEASINLAEKILTIMRDAEWRVYAQTQGVGMQPAFKAFYTGRALFRPSGFSAITKCGQWAEIEYGILPMPKVLDSQEGYYTNTTGTFVASVPKNCEDPEFSAYILDACAAGAKQYVTPAYIEVNLKRKSLRDNDSEAVLEYIFSHLVYDVGRVYNFGDVHTMFYQLAQNHSVDVASSLDSIREMIDIEIENVIADYEINEME